MSAQAVGVLSGSTARSANSRAGRWRYTIVLGIGQPRLKRRSGPCADAAAQVDRTRKASSGNPPMECRACQGRHADHVPDAIKRWNDFGSAVVFSVDRAARAHRRPLGDDLPAIRRLRRRLCAGHRPPLLRWRLSRSCSAKLARPTERRVPRVCPRRLRCFENRRTRHNPAIAQRSRRVRRATS
jgi:hypothetical protein